MQEKNYLSVTIFVLIIFILLLGGNYLIKNRDKTETSKLTDTRIDKTKAYVYFSDSNTVSEDLDLVYNTIHINIDNKDAKRLEEELNSEMTKAYNSIKKTSTVSFDKRDIVYELDDNNDIYEADYLKYDVLDNDNYLTIGVIKGHVNITSDMDNNTLKYYTFNKKDGHIMSMEEIKNVGKIKDSDIENTKKTYLEDKEDTKINSYELYIDKYGNVRMNMLVNSGNITYNDTVKIN